MDFTLVPFTSEHLDAVLAIERLSFPAPWSRAVFERELSLHISHFFVALASDGVIGYGGFWQVLDEAHIVTLAVRPDRRGGGIGRRILRHLVDHMIDSGAIHKILLEVRSGNATAQRLYESEGFRTVGLRPKYYEMTEDAILMERSI